MTDVPFFCLNLWTFYCFIRYHQSNRLSFFCVRRIIVCLVSFHSANLLLFFPIAWLVSMLLSKPINKKNLTIAISPVIVLLVFYFSYTFFYERKWSVGRKGIMISLVFYPKPLVMQTPKLLVNIPGYFFIVLAYLGLLLAPLHISALFNLKTSWKFFSILYTLIVSSLLIFLGKTIPCFR